MGIHAAASQHRVYLGNRRGGVFRRGRATSERLGPFWPEIFPGPAKTRGKHHGLDKMRVLRLRPDPLLRWGRRIVG